MRKPGSQRRTLAQNCILFVVCLMAEGTLAHSSAGQVQSGKEREEVAAAKVAALGEIVSKDSQGRIEGILFFERGLGTSPSLNHLTDEDVESIDFAAFTGIKHLNVFACKITDRSLAKFAMIPTKLKSLEFETTKVTDKGMTEFLTKQTALYSLSLMETPIGDQALSAIVEIRSLRMLTVSGSPVTDKGVKELAKLKHLFALYLPRTDITDEAMLEVAKLEKLRFLDISGTRVSDAGISRLAAATNLTRLRVTETKVTDQGKRDLQMLLPALKFDR